MYAIADLTPISTPEVREDPIERELAEIEDLRRRALANRDILYCSPAVRHLVETEIPRLAEIIQRMRRGGDPERHSATDHWAHRTLAELRQEIQIVRDLIERS